MVNLENLLVKLKIPWINFRRSVQSYLSYDYDRCLELIMISGGIRSVAGVERWKRNCLTLYRLLGFYQFAISLARVGFSIRNQDELVHLFACILIAMGLIIASVKVRSLEHYEDVIRQSKTLLSSNTGHSSDPDYDAAVRRNATRTAGKVTLAIFIMLCCNQVMLWVPNSARDRILGIPEQFQVAGSMAVCLLQGAYVSTYAIFWGSRYFCTSITILPMLMGLRSELMLVARGYETIEDRVQAHVLDDQDNTTGPPRMHLKWILRVTVGEHVEVLKNIQFIQPVVSEIYATIYYSTMIAASLIVLLVIRGEVSLMSTVMVLSVCIIVLECYFWCQLTDSCQEITEKITDAVSQLGFRLEHSVDNHSEYIAMRTSLMIVQLNASKVKWFSCGGIFPISVESFGELCMIIYRFATFLMDLD